MGYTSNVSSRVESCRVEPGGIWAIISDDIRINHYAQRNETETQNCYEIVLFQFHFVVQTVLRIKYIQQ